MAGKSRLGVIKLSLLTVRRKLKTTCDLPIVPTGPYYCDSDIDPARKSRELCPPHPKPVEPARLLGSHGPTGQSSGRGKYDPESADEHHSEECQPDYDGVARGEFHPLQPAGQADFERLAGGHDDGLGLGPEFRRRGAALRAFPRADG